MRSSSRRCPGNSGSDQYRKDTRKLEGRRGFSCNSGTFATIERHELSFAAESSEGRGADLNCKWPCLSRSFFDYDDAVVEMYCFDDSVRLGQALRLVMPPFMHVIHEILHL